MSESVSSEMSDSLLQKLREITTHKGYVPDGAELRGGVECAIRNSWLFHNMALATPCLRDSQLYPLLVGEGETTNHKLTTREAAARKALELALKQSDEFDMMFQDAQSKGNGYEFMMEHTVSRKGDPLGRLITATREFLAVLEELHRRAQAFGREYVHVRAEVRAKLWSIEGADRVLQQYFQNPPLQRPKMARGRPIGSRKHLACRAFVRDLLTAVDNAGGRLVFNKNYPENGTLLPVLRLLRPHLPQGVICSPPPRLLAEICATWRTDRGRKIDRSPDR